MTAPALELDHVFVCTAVGAPEAERLLALGLAEGAPNVHPGQGTANRRFFFRNAFLGLLWVHDVAEARSARTTPLRLWERWAGRHDLGVTPFGVCLRGAPGGEVPFPTWAYRPAYLPPELPIPIAACSVALADATAAEVEAVLAAPMLFVFPRGQRPDQAPTERAHPLAHRAGFGELTCVAFADLPTGGADTPRSADAPALRVERSGADRPEHPVMMLDVDGATVGQVADLRPALLLVLRW